MASSSVMQSLSNELSSIAEQVGPSVVAVRARHRTFSSGIQWRKGVIVTVDHGISRDENVTVVVEGGTSIPATVAGRDPSTDLAVLKVEASALPLAQTGEGGTAKVGEIVLALGRSLRGNVVASAGIIGGVSGEWRTWRGGRLDQQIRLDLELYPGFSGGPLVGANGTIVGINTRGLARGRAVTIPVSTVNQVVDELLEKGHIAKPYLGLAMQPVAIPEQLRSGTKPHPSTGLLVVHVDPGAPAEQAGILLGDVLLEIDGKTLGDMETLRDLIGSGKVGDKLTINLLRGGKAQIAIVTLTDRPGK
jgi:S1-C subfamily serine protease